jgi:predicted ATP-dependent endonuclease of OLD family
LLGGKIVYISKITLKDFKAYADTVTIEVNKQFNVIIGENNIGKSTIFEALLLWKKCYDETLTSNKRDFYSQSVQLYISFDELYFLRITKDEDLFYGSKRTCEIAIEFKEDDGSACYTLGFSLTKPSIENSYIRLSRKDTAEFLRFKDSLESQNIKLVDFLFIQQTEPVAKVLAKEPYMYPGQIKKKIEKGKSHEVLRNKIISCDLGILTQRMKSVLECEFEFKTPPRTERERAEYINLLVIQNGKRLDVGLQGSGFLQVAEIFSSIAIMDNALNILLIDEPDSHISPRIQNNLLKCIKEIAKVQVFVISHNDNFVSEVQPNEVIFVNSENKGNGIINALNDVNIDALHSALGGVITGLTRLQKSKRVIFVEGEDDISYLKSMNEALKNIGSDKCIDFSKVSFWYIRGKDDLKLKVMANKQLLSQAVPNCKYAAIFDKDFSTVDANNRFIDNEVKRRLGNGAWVHTHNGYCIESVLFSDKDKLKRYLIKLAGDNYEESIREYVESFYQEIKEKLESVRSDMYGIMKNKFASQKKPTRPELEHVEFDNYAAEASETIQFAMLKDNIKSFVIGLEDLIGNRLIERTDDESETVAAGMLNTYLNTVDSVSDMYVDYLDMFTKIKAFIE